MNTELICPKKERIWGWPAVANFILGGMGSGYYLLSSVHMLFQGALPGSQAGTANILSPLLICLGFLALTLEAGRPLKGVYLLSNLRSSWISIEVLAGSLFISTSILDRLFPSEIFHLVAFFAALGLIVSQGFIFYRSGAITAWNVTIIPMLFFTSAFVLGGGLFLLVGILQQGIAQKDIFIIIMICLIADMIAWVMYVMRPWDAYFMRATAFLRRSVSLFLVLGLGHLIPLTIMAVLMTAGGPDNASLRFIFIVLAGLCMITGGMGQKIAIILGANFLRGMVMGKPKDNAKTLMAEMNSARPDMSQVFQDFCRIFLKKSDG